MAHSGVTFKIPDRYEYKGPRLAGGQGYVYIYTDNFLRRPVAIKEMKHPGDAGALRDELAKIREIRSRHVIEVYDLFEAKRSDRIALVEEYVPGQTLDELVAGGEELSEYDATRILWQIATGLSDIHHHGIIHRDIKPQNIKHDGEGIIKILDFGISSIAAPDAETIAARGTIHYIPPELYGTPPISLRKRVDVYAFGICAWYLLNGGKLPSALKETPPQSRTAVPSLQEATLVLPQPITDLLDAAIDTTPTNRPTARKIRDALYRQLTAGQHRLIVTHGGQRQELSKTQPRATLRVGSSSLTINYDDLNFSVQGVEGNVYLNNQKIAPGATVPDSCVITFGDSTEGPFRTFVPMTILSPEIVL